MACTRSVVYSLTLKVRKEEGREGKENKEGKKGGREGEGEEDRRKHNNPFIVYKNDLARGAIL